MSAQDFTVNNSILPVEVIRVYCMEFSKKILWGLSVGKEVLTPKISKKFFEMALYRIEDLKGFETQERNLDKSRPALEDSLLLSKAGF